MPFEGGLGLTLVGLCWLRSRMACRVVLPSHPSYHSHAQFTHSHTICTRVHTCPHMHTHIHPHPHTQYAQVTIAAGKVPTIEVKVEKRMGKKLVTILHGLEGLGIDPAAFAKDAQKRFACAASVNVAVGGNGGEKVRTPLLVMLSDVVISYASCLLLSPTFTFTSIHLRPIKCPICSLPNALIG